MPTTPALRACLASTAAGAAVVGALAGLSATASPATARAATTVLVDQSFTEAASAQDFDVVGRGSWLVGSGRYRGTSTTGGVASRALSIHGAPLAPEAWTLDTWVRPVGTAPTKAAVVFDFRDRSNYSFAQLGRFASSSGVYSVRDGVTSRVAPLAGRFVAGAGTVIELRRNADGVKVYAGPTRATIAYVGRAAVPSSTGLRVGYAAVTGTVRFDDLSVTTPTTTTPTPTQPSAPPPTVAPSDGRAVQVATSAQLTAALADARAGDVITMADGVYTSGGLAAPVAIGGKHYVGTFVATASGTADRPIVLQGSRRAQIDGRPGGDGTGTRYGLYLAGAGHWQLKGFTVTNVSKGIVLDHSQRSVLQDLAVHTTGQEGIHLRAASSDNVVRDSTVRLTGRTSPDFGEGIYVGSATSNWGTYSGGLPDASDRNQLVGNTITQTGAESVDVKEGTTGGVISGNTFDGATMTGSYADSWVDLKGNGWLVTGNRGSNAVLDGFQVHGVVDGWGLGNTFRDNVADVNASGFGFRAQSNVTGTVVSCSNTVSRAASGFANLPCR